MSGMTWFLFAVGGVSLIIYWMMTRAQNRSRARRSAYDGSGTDSNFGAAAAADDGWSLSSWFGGDSSSSHNSGSSSDSGGSERRRRRGRRTAVAEAAAINGIASGAD